MDEPKLTVAELAARRFLARADDMRVKLKDDEHAWMGCPESGALRRASMDLTRALAVLRKP